MGEKKTEPENSAKHFYFAIDSSLISLHNCNFSRLAGVASNTYCLKGIECNEKDGNDPDKIREGKRDFSKLSFKLLHFPIFDLCNF